jgi:UDP-N-acetylglucosamine--N-acetylmuramyl-(pentapeptide) pyrophosphoryl-undecaprenol N-acetylglucosamine transferase
MHLAHTVRRLLMAILHSAWILLRIGTKAVFGTGGYAAFPVCAAAVLLGKPLFLLEPNVVPGAANVLLAAFARTTFTSQACLQGSLQNAR